MAVDKFRDVQAVRWDQSDRTRFGRQEEKVRNKIEERNVAAEIQRDVPDVSAFQVQTFVLDFELDLVRDLVIPAGTWVFKPNLGR